MCDFPGGRLASWAAGVCRGGGGLLEHINANYAKHCLYFLLLIGAGKEPRLDSKNFQSACGCPAHTWY